ncbi:N-acetyltransferase GCN5 [Ktedonobacter sp. SOSP1-52]|uniref:GNAT family N-acetyltransferase n=1 Tax=Ktedonobacter sp. SOSP1-52 TaxID=2778366 RepID=UPI0019164A8C|nr:GNAT family protein [Ktedonobacter sp. SOSP1-52]GHO65044.1 N-acetyltransferase GCN5 [Ktedonobacter sp. SOSP1-52]
MAQDSLSIHYKLSPSQETIYIRPVQASDAEACLALMRQLDQETTFMLLEPEERKNNPDELLKRFAHQQEDMTSDILFMAEHGERLIGCLGAERGRVRRTAHSAHIFIGILQAYTGKGIGTQLFLAVENWARSLHLRRLALDVHTHNKAGIALYTRRGFVIEGTLKDAYYVRGQFVDAYAMAKILADI